MDGITLIAQERIRQLEKEGWSASHDDDHADGSLASAAACYADLAAQQAVGDDNPCTDRTPPNAWPWSAGWWKPKDMRRNLVRAGALIAAELDRLNGTSPDSARVARSRPESVSFEGDGKVAVDVDALIRSPRFQQQVEAVRELADSCAADFHGGAPKIQRPDLELLEALKALRADEWRCTVDWGPRDERHAINARCDAAIAAAEAALAGEPLGEHRQELKP